MFPYLNIDYFFFDALRKLYMLLELLPWYSEKIFRRIITTILYNKIVMQMGNSVSTLWSDDSAISDGAIKFIKIPQHNDFYVLQ
jgi:hypothetical protein